MPNPKPGFDNQRGHHHSWCGPNSNLAHRMETHRIGRDAFEKPSQLALSCCYNLIDSKLPALFAPQAEVIQSIWQ